MKLSTRDANAYFAKPDPDAAGLLIYGNDAMRVALKRQQVIAALIGPQGEDEMRLERLAAGDIRKDPAALLDAVKAQSFFPGARAVLVQEATDTTADAITAALQDWQSGDAQVIVTAGTLNARSKLRKLFEGHPRAFVAAIYDDPPGPQEVQAMLSDAGLKDLSDSARQDVMALARILDPGDLRNTIEKLALYKLGDATPLSSEEVAALAPTSTEADVDELIHCVAETQETQIAPVLSRLQSQGATPVGLCIAALRHFRTLHAAASDPGGVSSGLSRVRPPVFGPRRDRMQRQAQNWGVDRLEQALSTLIETDLTLRSASKSPQMALIERTMIRLAIMGKR